VPSLLPVAALPRRDRLVISICTLIVVAIAWLYLVHLDHQMSSSMQYDKMMAEMGMEKSWTAADVFFTFTMWAVMMVGMMAGTVAPVLLLFAAAHAGRDEGRAPAPVLMFGLGYLALWVGFSAGAALVQWGLHQAALLSPAMTASSPRLSGAILIAAGAYQLTSWKSSCLRQCRSPLGFLMANWRDGTFGAMQMGLRHGAYCLGCCWALMCLLFVVGVMNLVWVAVLTGFVLIEKIGPAGATVARVAGAVMIVAGIALFAGIA
jgi:predicted metal-binding membrane protein